MKSIKQWIVAHPNLAAWSALASGMVIILFIEARDVGLEAAQWFWLMVITVLVAGACVWIIGWGVDETEAPGAAPDAARTALEEEPD